jgi:hypothetical protein
VYLIAKLDCQWVRILVFFENQVQDIDFFRIDKDIVEYCSFVAHQVQLWPKGPGKPIHIAPVCVQDVFISPANDP